MVLSSAQGYTHIIAFETHRALREWTRAIHQHTVTTVTLLEVTSGNLINNMNPGDHQIENKLFH